MEPARPALSAIAALALLLLVQAAAVGVLAALHARAPGEPTARALFIVASGQEPPPATAAWVEVGLPHEWWLAGLREVQQGWYRLRVAAPEDAGQTQGVLLWQVGAKAQVFVNGTAVDAALQDANGWRPLYTSIPAARWQAQDNELAIRVAAAQPGTGYLGPVFVGADSVLAPAYRARYFLKVELMLLGALMMLALGLSMTLLGYWRGGDNVYAYFGISGVAWACSTLIFSVPALARLGPLVDWVYASCINLFVVAITLFMHRFVGLQRPALERWMRRISALVAGVGLLLAASAPARFYFMAQTFWIPVVVFLYFYPVSIGLRHFWRRPWTGGYWLMQASAVTLSLGLYDLTVYSRMLSAVEGTWSDYSAPYIAVVFGFILLRHFHLSLRESETLNRELNERVLGKQAELERAYQALRQNEQQRTLAEERERIQREMHDGLGGTLVSTLAGLELQGAQASPAAQSLRGALDDLRLMIFSLDQGSGPLRVALGMLRERLTRLGDDASLAVTWSMQELPADLALERGSTLQLMRIVQEAFTNTVKHAGARTFSLSATLQSKDGQAGVMVEMRDDGRGIDPMRLSGAAGCYGLANMRLRALKLGGPLEFGPAEPGTRIRLWVPVGLPSRIT